MCLKPKAVPMAAMRRERASIGKSVSILHRRLKLTSSFNTPMTSPQVHMVRILSIADLLIRQSLKALKVAYLWKIDGGRKMSH